MNLKDIDRFWSKVEMKDGCWAWLGAVFKGTKQRGQFKLCGRTVKAHRLAYSLIRGTIPEGLTIDHLCRNPNCVNPWHLEAVTAEINRNRVPRDILCKRGHARVAGTRRCQICSTYFRPGRSPEIRRLQYLKYKERGVESNTSKRA